MKKKDITTIFLILILITLFTGCTENNSNDGPVEWGNAPDFSLKTLKGENIKLSNYIGKVIIIDLMGVNCQYCMYMMPVLKEISENYTDVIIISVDVYQYETEEYLQSYIDAFKEQLNMDLDWTFGMDSNGDISSYYLAEGDGVPKLVMIDQNGNIYYTINGYSPNAKTEIANKLDEII